MRILLHAVITVAVLAVCNGMILQKQRVVKNGRTVLLRLAPVDPRSLMQGDYMALRYEIAANVPAEKRHRDTAVIRLDAAQVGAFVRLDRGEPLAADEQRLQFRRRHESVRLGAESFFFQEGNADLFAVAKYGELKVAPNGASVLVGLRNTEMKALRPSGGEGAAKHFR